MHALHDLKYHLQTHVNVGPFMGPDLDHNLSPSDQQSDESLVEKALPGRRPALQYVEKLMMWFSVSCAYDDTKPKEEIESEEGCAHAQGYWQERWVHYRVNSAASDKPEAGAGRGRGECESSVIVRWY